MYEGFANEGLVKTLGIEVISIEPDHAEIDMPITPDLLQPFGWVHGGATAALLESCASYGALASCDLNSELALATHLKIDHRRSARDGYLHATADLEKTNPSKGRSGGVNQHWAVYAKDDEGNVISEGTVIMRIMKKENMPGAGAQKNPAARNKQVQENPAVRNKQAEGKARSKQKKE